MLMLKQTWHFILRMVKSKRNLKNSSMEGGIWKLGLCGVYDHGFALFSGSWFRGKHFILSVSKLREHCLWMKPLHWEDENCEVGDLHSFWLLVSGEFGTLGFHRALD
ncbi:unnamed protein product [Ilex paraguariensis]|uniref:Uncharacterized protein n=1 Tax=Ilex paraguariensis TaxID=185542 RepID=A0ABC8R2M0_9AQUA